MTTGLFVGLLTVDLSYRLDEFPAANSKVVALSQDLFAGGPATNASVAFAHLGGHATLVTVVGRHVLSGAIAEELERYSIQLIDLNPGFSEAPVISSIAVNKAGERSVISANATRITTLPAKIDEALLDDVSVVLVDGHYMQACQAWSKAAQARRIHVVLDGGSWKPGTEELLKNVDTAICSADFMPPGCSIREEVFAYLNSCGLLNIAITNGGEPIRFISDEGSGTISVPEVDTVDTLGAGDILHGAFCYYSSLGQVFQEALTNAVRVASESCRFRGTREWMNQDATPRALASQKCD